jgi:hypothetical protein
MFSRVRGLHHPMRARWMTTVLAVLVAAVLGGGIAAAATHGSSHPTNPQRAAGPTVPPARPSSTSVPSRAATPASPNAPVNVDVFSPSPNWFWVPDAAAGTGPVDIQEAAALDGVSTLSSVGLAQLGFVRGITRQWQSDDTILVDLVYTFRTAAGARAYATSTVHARAIDPAFTAVQPAAGSPSGAVSYTTTSAGSHSRVTVFAAGPHAVVMGLVENGTVPDATQLAQFAAAQAAVSDRR